MWAQDKGAEESAQTKITKVVFYKHGMGYFERECAVKGDATITLGFKTNQMKDILTSFFVVDKNGGKITTVSYDSKDPIDKQLENILIRVPENAALTQFLAQLKGTKIEVKIGNEVLQGTIMGIEPVSQKIDNMTVTAYKLVILKTDGEIKPVNLLEISSLKILDEPIQKDLKRVLDIYLNAKYTDRKQVKVICSGKGDRNIMMGYQLEMPIWKTSYRLILDEKEKPYLQGWAIVENPTDDDWTDVNMSFIAGNPISFSMDLYTSYYPQRPEISLASIIPLVGALFNTLELTKGNYEMADSDKMAESNEWKSEGGYGYPKKSKSMAPAPGLMPPTAPSMSMLLQNSVNALTSGMQVGELFAYNAKTPVTISRRQAAMVPIITDTVEGNKILYYRAQVSPRLMNAFYMTNSTKLTLETGPMTIFEGSTSVGEGLLKESLQAGMKEILPYAIETGCTIEVTNKYTAKPVHKCKITNGIMVMNSYSMNETTYKLTNKTGRNQVVYLDHPRTGGYTLMEPKKAEEEIPGYYRFKLDLASGKSIDFTVTEQAETASQIYLQNINTDQIRFYLSQSPLSSGAKKFLEELAVLMGQVSEQKRIYSEYQVELDRLSREQNEYRQNLNVLNINNPKERELREKWVDKLDKAVERVDTLKSLMKETLDKQNALQQELVKKIQSFND
jgi:hypothetical protein